MKYFFFLLIHFSFTPASGQINPGPRITALASSGVVWQDVWSLQANQAGLAILTKPAAAVAYQSSYLNPEVNTKSAVFAIPHKNNVFGLSFQKYGFSAFKEQKIGFTYAKRFGDNLFAAVNVNYYQISIDKYGSASTYSVEAGLQYKANDKLLIGAHVANPNRSSYDKELNATIPVNIEFGVSYKFSDKLLIASELEKNLASNTDLKSGLEYSLINWLSLRGGVSLNPFKQYVGFGINYLGLQIDAAASSHPHLGYSPQIGLGYEF